jgi:hypothetical protein
MDSFSKLTAVSGVFQIVNWRDYISIWFRQVLNWFGLLPTTPQIEDTGTFVLKEVALDLHSWGEHPFVIMKKDPTTVYSSSFIKDSGLFQCSSEDGS